MGRRSKIAVALPKIRATFERSSHKVFTFDQLREIYSQNVAQWDLAQKDTFMSWRDYLIEHEVLSEEVLDFPQKSRTIYCFDEPSLFEKASKITASAYISHYSAAYLHNLTEQIPKTIYTTVPQEQKSKRVLKLTTQQIEASMASPFKKSQNIITTQHYTIIQLNSVSVDECFDVYDHQRHGNVRVSTVEKTLIDMAVRPEYSGGIHEVLKAYQNAEGVSTNKVRKLLKRHQYVYPYQQVIGYYMEKSGAFNQTALGMMKSLGIEDDFFLMKGLDKAKCRYVPAWKLYVPLFF